MTVSGDAPRQRRNGTARTEVLAGSAAAGTNADGARRPDQYGRRVRRSSASGHRFPTTLASRYGARPALSQVSPSPPVRPNEVGR